MKQYGCIIADPPWWEAGGGKIKRGADRHYPLMKTSDICDLPVKLWTLPDAHLYLWTTNNFLEDALLVVKAWGFKYISMITWAKEDGFGLGQYFRGKTEHVLFCRKGQPPYRTDQTGKRSQGLTLFWSPRTKHSEKPTIIHEYAEAISPEPRLEMFARSSRLGWDSWGNEAPKIILESC